MGNDRYQPPKQSAGGQIFDSLFLLALVVLSLFAPLWLGLAGGGKTTTEFADKTWQGMGQTPVQQAAWEKLGQTAETAQPMIASHFDYAFDPIMVAITAFVVVFYFVFVVRYSDREYREVIRERFGDK
jgi:hypothetical protein